jgi:hypothetical protein
MMLTPRAPWRSGFYEKPVRYGITVRTSQNSQRRKTSAPLPVLRKAAYANQPRCVQNTDFFEFQAAFPDGFERQVYGRLLDMWLFAAGATWEQLRLVQCWNIYLAVPQMGDAGQHGLQTYLVRCRERRG